MTRAHAASRRAVMISALMFVLGFSTVFVALGASASLIGGLIRAWSAAAFDRRRHRHHRHGAAFPRADPDRVADARGPADRFQSRSGLWGAYVMGLAFAFGWTPCIGPILAAILSVAAAEATVTKGAGLLAVYSAGLGIPFLIAAFMVEQFSVAVRADEAASGQRRAGDGRADGITGIGFLTGSVSAISIWLLETFPALAEFRLSARNKDAGATKLSTDRGAVTDSSCLARLRMRTMTTQS